MIPICDVSEQNREEKLHLLFPTGLLKAPDWQAWKTQWWVMFFVFNPSLAGAGHGEGPSRMEPVMEPMIHTAQAANNEEAPSVPGTVLGTGWKREAKVTKNSWARSEQYTQPSKLLVSILQVVGTTGFLRCSLTTNLYPSYFLSFLACDSLHIWFIFCWCTELILTS